MLLNIHRFCILSSSDLICQTSAVGLTFLYYGGQVLQINMLRCIWSVKCLRVVTKYLVSFYCLHWLKASRARSCLFFFFFTMPLIWWSFIFRTRMDRVDPRNQALGHQRAQSQRPAGSDGQASASVPEQTEGKPRRGFVLFSGEPPNLSVCAVLDSSI